MNRILSCRPESRPAPWPLRPLSWRSILTAVVVLYGLRLCLLFAEASAESLDFSPVNGTFQTFNPVRRLVLGQFVGRDFDVYLGLGPTYLTRAASLIFGADYRGVLEASHWIAALSFWISIVILGRLCALPMLVAGALATLATALATQPQPSWFPDDAWRVWVETSGTLVAPSNSLLSLRAFVPFLAVTIVYGAKGWRRIGERGRERRMALVMGGTAGAAAVWSNDYGIPTAGVLIAASWFGFLRSARGRAAGLALWTCASALVSAVCIVTLATGGFPHRWFDYNFLGVARDQAWYFASSPASSIDALVPLLGTAALFVLPAKSCSSRARSTDPWLAVVLAATLIGGLVANFARASPHYFYAVERCLWFVVPYLAVEYGRLAWARIRSRSSAIAPNPAPRRFKGRVPEVLAAACVLVVSFITEGRDGNDQKFESLGRFEASEMGGVGPSYLAKMAVLGREIRGRAEKDGVPRKRRLFSTYATALELFADAVQPTGDDYVIHALGPARRANYPRALIELEPLYVSTLRAGEGGFEAWVQRLNWDLYREILARYEPFEQTVFHTLWRKRSTALPACAAIVEVEVRPADSDPGTSGVPIEVRFPPEVGLAHKQGLLVELEVEYEVISHRPWPLPCTPIVEQRFAPSVVSSFGIPPYETQWRFPVTVRPGQTLTSYLRVQPEGSGSVRVRAARARPIGPFRDLMRPKLERLLPASESNANWRKGIAPETLGSGFLVDDIEDVKQIQVGSLLRFAGAEARRVREITGRAIWIEGTALDPERDGFPNWVEIVRR